MLRRGPFGLRGRIVGAVLITTVATLVVAAVSLLGPLENRLRDAELKTLRGQLGRDVLAPFAALDDDLLLVQDASLHVPAITRKTPPQEAEKLRLLRIRRQNGVAARRKLTSRERSLFGRIGAAEVVLLGFPDPRTGAATVVARVPSDEDLLGREGFDDATQAFLTGRRVITTRSIRGVEYARAALPFTTSALGRSTQWVLVVRKSLAEVTDAAQAVQTAFLGAALTGLALTMLLAIPLSSTVVRRLRHLRQAALELAGGSTNVEFGLQRARDEVGDLARTLAMMQAQLRQQEEVRRAFVATASHELRTPLTSLEGMLELIDEDLASPEPDLDDARALLARAREQSHRLGRLAADLLDLSRIDAQVRLRSEPVELGELSRAVLAEFEIETSDRGINCVLQDDGERVWALGDPGSVARILRILIDNAVRVSGPDSEIRVELHDGEKVTLSVQDQGPGIPGDEREMIFQRFQRGRNALGHAGFGLGLAIGRELAQRMGGELVLEANDGLGASFTLRLPAAAAPQRDAVSVA